MSHVDVLEHTLWAACGMAAETAHGDGAVVGVEATCGVGMGNWSAGVGMGDGAIGTSAGAACGSGAGGWLLSEIS
jgi:hypothetical protein